MKSQAKKRRPRLAVGGGKRSKPRGTTTAKTRKKKRKKKTTAKPDKTRPLLDWKTHSPRSGRGVGLAAGVCVIEVVGTQVEVTSSGKEHVRTGKATAGRADMILAEAGQKLGRGVDWTRVADAWAAAGNVHRLRILNFLLEGPATYRHLQKTSGLQVGPLYHHIGKLRLAGLMTPKQRDLYALTRAGRNLALLTTVVGPLLKDSRLRPQPTE
ncbi:MAG: winged helix-turn-helix transcriptional regulator [Phycisphaerae bacterium]|nr:winged helix-turn-helix transcriptional regulator [Phycisphaerae bacterium]